MPEILASLPVLLTGPVLTRTGDLGDLEALFLARPVALAAVLALLVALALGLERRFRWAGVVGSSLLVIAFGALLSNLELVPLRSPLYGGITGPVTSLAIAWLLLAVDLRALRDAGPRMLGAFTLALAATVTGALAAAGLFFGRLGETTADLAGVMTGTYSGGSLNFVSVGRVLELPDSLFTAATAADNVLTALWMGVTLMAPLWLARWYPSPPAPLGSAVGGDPGSAGDDSGPAGLEDFLGEAPLRISHLAALLALGLVLLEAAEAVAGVVPGVPSVVWLTTLALAVGQVPAVQRLEGALHLGTLALLLFFVVIGIGSRVGEILAVGPAVFWFTLVVVAVHGGVVYGAGRLLRLDALTLSIASQAAVGGPSTALAVGVARGRRDLALPGMMVGLLGYAAGTYLGLAVAALLGGGG